MDFRTSYLNKKVLITGGLGMIGSTIANKLVKLGASVTLVDACLEPYGSNLFNIASIKDYVDLSVSDIRDKESIRKLVKEKDIVFNLAGQVSHNDSISDPFLDADINYIGHLNILESLKLVNPTAVIIHAGSRLQFGKIQSIPVAEDVALNPLTPYALNKSAAENMYLFYNRLYQIPCVLFRIANPYGPRSQMKHSKYSMVNWFIRLAMENKALSIFGDGSQIRDYIYVDDLAEAMIVSAVTPAAHGQVFNVGSGTGTTFKEMVDVIVNAVGSGHAESIPWPENYVNVETGDYVSDVHKLSEYTSWTPKINIQDGINNTCNYYKLHHKSYF